MVHILTARNSFVDDSERLFTCTLKNSQNSYKRPSTGVVSFRMSMGKLPHILVIPFPRQGHITPLVEFSHQLVDHGVGVTFVNTESIHRKLFPTLPDSRDEKKESMIHFISVPDGLVDENKGSQNPVEVMLESMAIHVEELITKINESDTKIDFVVADVALGKTLEVAERFGIQVVAFWPASLGVLAFMLHVPKLIAAGEIDDKGDPVNEEVIRLPLSMPAMSRVDLMWGNPKMQKMMFTIIHHVNKASKVAKYMFCNSFPELEPSSLDFIPNILTVGPLLDSKQLGHSTGQLLPEDSTCLAWLNQQPVQSVTYIAFGSTTIFNQKQFNELLHGLELLSGPFLWVLRPDLTAEVSTSNLDGFRGRIADRGKIVDWAPQKEVLAHPAIACFITHCGWNSTMEGISNGVPLLCWPYVADQFPNQNYICNIWKVGLKFDKDENGVVTGSEFRAKVQELLGDEDIRSRASNLKLLAKQSISEGGSSLKNLEDFIHIIHHSS